MRLDFPPRFSPSCSFHQLVSRQKLLQQTTAGGPAPTTSSSAPTASSNNSRDAGVVRDTTQEQYPGATANDPKIPSAKLKSQKNGEQEGGAPEATNPAGSVTGPPASVVVSAKKTYDRLPNPADRLPHPANRKSWRSAVECGAYVSGIFVSILPLPYHKIEIIHL